MGILFIFFFFFNHINHQYSYADAERLLSFGIDDRHEHSESTDLRKQKINSLAAVDSCSDSTQALGNV